MDGVTTNPDQATLFRDPEYQAGEDAGLVGRAERGMANEHKRRAVNLVVTVEPAQDPPPAGALLLPPLPGDPPQPVHVARREPVLGPPGQPQLAVLGVGDRRPAARPFLQRGHHTPRTRVDPPP